MYEEQTEEKRGRVWERGGERRIERFISGDRRGRERKGKCAFSPPPPGFCKSILPRKRWKEEEEDQNGEIFVGSINHELFFLGKKMYSGISVLWGGRVMTSWTIWRKRIQVGLGTKQVSFSSQSG